MTVPREFEITGPVSPIPFPTPRTEALRNTGTSESRQEKVEGSPWPVAVVHRI